MTKIILFVVLSVALGVSAGPYRGRNVDVPVELIKEPITVELLKEEIIFPVEQLKVAEEVDIQEPVALISEKIVNKEENRVETVIVQETLVPQLKVEAAEEKIETEAKPVIVEVIESIKTIVPVAETVNIETVASPVEAEQKIEILEAAEPGVKTVVTEEEEIKSELKQDANAPPQSPGLIGIVQNIIQNNPLNNLINRGSTPTKADGDAESDGASETAADPPGRPNLVQQFQSTLLAGIENVQQSLATTFGVGTATSNTDGTAPSPTLLQNVQSAISGLIPGQAMPPAAGTDSAPAQGSGPVQTILSNVQSTFQNLVGQRRPADAAAVPAKPAEAAVEATAEVAGDEQKSVETVEPVKSEEEPEKEQ